MTSQHSAKFLASIGAMVAILTTCVQAQSGNWDPFVENVTISPAPLLPLEFNGTGVASLKPGNNGGSDLPLGSSSNSNDRMVVTISLANGVPNVAAPSDPVQALTALGGPGAIYWDWTYVPGTKTFRGVQNRPIPAYTAEEVTIQYKVTVNTFSGASPFAFNGINVNISPPSYTNPQNTDNDKASSYTYVFAQDFGDAPITYGAAVHTIDVTKDADGFYNHYMFLGRVVYPEPAYQASSNDQDGVTFPVLTPGSTVTIPVAVTIVDGDQTGYAGWLSAWFDWNGNGTFTDASERVATNVYVDYNTLGGATTGTVNLQVTVPSTAKVGQTWARFRFGPSLTGTNAPYKAAAYGEVEDYQVTIQSQPATIGDFVWQDTNGNGIQDAGEPGISNATVRLLDVSSNLLATTTTTTNGAYAFTNLVPGTYLLQFVAPSGFVFTAQNAGTNTAVDSDANPVTGMTAPVTLTSGQNDMARDAGLYRLAMIYGYGFMDNNANLVRDAGDGPVTNMLAMIWTNGMLVASTRMDAAGYYSFLGLVPGTYEVRFLCHTNALVAVPTATPASTNVARNRAVGTTNDNAYIFYTLVSGSGVVTAGEPLNVGFKSGLATAAAVLIRAYATAEGVVVEFQTIDEAGGNDMVLYLYRNGKWVEVGRQPSVGEGNNTYRFIVPGLAAGDVCNLKVVDDEGFSHTALGLTVGTFASDLTLMDKHGLRLRWSSIPDHAYDIYWTDRLGGSWTLITTVQAIESQTSIVLDIGQSPTGFFKIVMQAP